MKYLHPLALCLISICAHTVVLHCLSITFHPPMHWYYLFRLSQCVAHSPPNLSIWIEVLPTTHAVSQYCPLCKFSTHGEIFGWVSNECATNPIAPSFAKGPPTLSAAPPILPSAVNCLPIEPSLLKALVPVPCVFSPTGVWKG